MSNMEPIQITLGEGKVAITNFHDSDGRGIIFQDTGEPHEIGSGTDDVDGEHIPQPGEIYIKCTNKESAMVLLERVERIIEGFGSVSDEMSQSNTQKFFIDSDNDGHHYVIPVERADEWSKFLDLDPESKEAWNVPDFAEPIGGSVTRVVFEKWEIAQ